MIKVNNACYDRVYKTPYGCLCFLSNVAAEMLIIIVKVVTILIGLFHCRFSRKSL